MIHGLAMRRKPNPSGSMIRIEEPPSGCQGRVDQGQEGTERGRQDGSKPT